MFTPSLRIALGKADSDSEGSALGECLRFAEALDEIESNFESRINASKADRGVKPTSLSAAKRSELSGYQSDADELAKQQLLQFEALLSAKEIASALRSALESDMKFWNSAAKHTHPADLPVVHELVGAKRSLLDALTKFVSRDSGISA